MVIKIRDQSGHYAPIELAVPGKTDVEIHLYPGDLPVIEPHNARGDSYDLRSFDVVVNPNGDLMLDWVNVTEVSNNPPNETKSRSEQTAGA